MKISWSAIKYLLGFLIILTLVIAAIAFNGLKKDQDLRAALLLKGERTSGKITDIHGSRGSKNKIDIEFRTLNGRSVKTTYYCVLRCPEISMITTGMKVDVVYDTVHPLKAIPAPYKNVPQRLIVSELLAFLRLLGLVVLTVSPVILGFAFLQNRLARFQERKLG
jgi:uncharacterized membrane protein YciS (DUF1049 family)